MLWIEKYRPKNFDEIIGQDRAINQLKSYAKHGSFPHLMIIGRSGTGKTSALEAFSDLFYENSAAENTAVIPVSVMFSQGHAYFSENEKFSHLYKKDKSVITNFKNIVKWHASLKPLSSAFRIIIFDGAGDLPKDAQAALRRIMEKYAQTCRFVFVTESMSSLIDPIRSRCVPMYFLPIDETVMKKYLTEILIRENVFDKVSEDNLDLIVMSSAGDLRKALVWLELMALYGYDDLSAFTKTETGILAERTADACRDGDISTAQSTAEDMMIQYGLSASDVAVMLKNALKNDMTPEIALIFADADINVRAGQIEYLQINALIAELCEALA
ncbi:MAG TPA: TniB family NTP-binding protein [Methanocorpusculum sp.]|nr:TniB family NTP-binding protein [Methanocorpusculum sp.]